MKAQVKLEKTSNYNLFLLHNLNRDVIKTKELEESMLEYGFLPSYPLHVNRSSDGRLIVKDGHHRLHVAQKLKIPVYYVVCEDNMTIWELNKTVNNTKWTNTDWLKSHLRNGNHTYIKIDEYCKLSGLSVLIVAGVLCYDNISGLTSQANQFKRGDLTIISSGVETMEKLIEILSSIKNVDQDILKSTIFVRALLRIMKVPEFNYKTFISKSNSHGHIFSKKACIADYSTMIEEIYNRFAVNKISLALAADNLARSAMIKKFWDTKEGKK